VDQIEHGLSRYEHISLPNQLVVRGSCGSIAPSNTAAYGTAPILE
jgi:hypothetical protein